MVTKSNQQRETGSLETQVHWQNGLGVCLFTVCELGDMAYRSTLNCLWSDVPVGLRAYLGLGLLPEARDGAGPHLLTSPGSPCWLLLSPSGLSSVFPEVVSILKSYGD